MPTSVIAGLAVIGGTLGATGAAAAIVGGVVAGAVIGGVTAAVTKGNVLKGMLIGGLVGGAVGGIGTLAMGAEAAGGEAAVGGAAAETAGTGGASLLAPESATQTIASSVSPGALDVAIPAAPEGLIATAPAAQGMTAGQQMMAATGMSAVGGAASGWLQGEAAKDAAKEQRKAQQEADQRAIEARRTTVADVATPAPMTFAKVTPTTSNQIVTPLNETAPQAQANAPATTAQAPQTTAQAAPTAVTSSTAKAPAPLNPAQNLMTYRTITPLLTPQGATA